MDTEKLLKPAYFYDKDFLVLKKQYENCRKILDDQFKNIQLRIERCKNLEISKSVFDYSNRLSQVQTSPEFFYNFTFLDVNIYVFSPRKGLYSIRVQGCPINCLPLSWNLFYDDLINTVRDNGELKEIYSFTLKKSSEDIDYIINLWKKCIAEYLRSKDLVNELF